VIELSSAMAREAYQLFKPYHGDPAHTNVYALGRMIEILRHKPKFANHQRTIVVAFIGDLMAPAFNNPEEDPNKLLRGSDLDHRLHQLSALKVEPNEINLDGLFDREIFVTTNHGPLLVSEFTRAKLDLMAVGGDLYVTGPIDKVGRMVDSVMPAKRVRIADPARVRNGAHLAEGTTVMHEGFVNHNAGTLGDAMVEGRISQGVIVDADSDIGGSFSIMGTMSGGGEHRVKLGKRFLGGANGGTGISHGDDCIVEAGTYIKAGTKVKLIGTDGKPTGKVVKAIELAGEPGLLFRTNSQTGAVEALPNTKATKLNPLLHA
jgi:2,3,4,5-tetrahydropyridine-2-carboxylate N-succinyltransferase